MKMNGRRALIGFTLMMSLLLSLGLIGLLDLPGWRAQAQTAVPEISVEQPIGTVIADGGSQDFGAVAKGSNQTLTFTIRNTGNAPLNLTGNPKVVIGGAHAADFTVTTQPASPVPANNVIVQNGGFESPNVVASVLGSGAYSGNWTFSEWAGIAGDSGLYYVLPPPEGDQAGIFVLAGHAISQVINFPSTGKYFIHFSATNGRGDLAGQIDVNMDGTLLGTALGNHERDDLWRTFIIPYNCTAAGNHTLSFNMVTNSGDSVIDDVRITAGDVFQVTFTPQGAGVRMATLSIANNDSNENPYNITLTGIGVPEISIEQPAGTPLVTGKVVAWGYNQQGQTNVPAGLEGVKAIAAGGLHTVALKGDGTVVSWGLFTQEAVPVWLTNVTAIAAGNLHTLALRSDGTVVAWGNNDIFQATVPAGLTGVVAIAASASGSAALKSDGTIVKWGYNLGTIPAGLTNVVDLAMGQTHTVALKSDGTVAAWGENFQGEANVPPDLAGVTAIAAGGYRSYAVKSNGKIVAWGAIDTFADGLTGVVDVAAGPHQTLALKNDATITAWGPNRYGETNVPAGLEGVRAISANGRDSGDQQSHSVALTDSTVDFGNQLVGVASAWKTFTVKNTGIGSLTISNVSVSGGDASNFDVNLSGMLTTVPPNGQTTFAIRFTPDSLAPKQASLRVLNNDTDEGSFYINLTGAGATPSPEIAVFNGASTAPAEERASNVGTYTFPSTFVGNTSSTHTFTIKNVGTANLSGIAITMAGANPEDFVLNTSGVSTLSPNLTRTFTVSFKPVAAGVRNAVVSIASNDSDENPFLINISGSGEKITYTFTASNTNDSGPGSLRQAMADAASDDTINFNLSGCPCTITLTSGQLSVDKTLKIIGPGANRLTISGNNASRVFEIVNDSTLTLTGLTIANGRHAENGGGIFSNHGGLLRVNDCNLSNNNAGSHGGAIFMGGPVNPDVQKLIIRNSLLALNHAVADGGAIYNVNTHMTIINSTISNNTAGGSGGGIFDDSVGTRTLIHCTLTGNRADADGNAAGNGGGIREEFGSDRIEVFRNTIVAGNFRGTGATPDDLAASIESAQNTLIGDAATAGGITNGTNGNKVEVAVNTVLDTVLAFNFGPTRTHKLIAGSPALDAGSNALALDADGSPLQTDQRGPGATRISNGVVDMGAFELSLIQTQPPAITGATISRQQGTSASNSQIATVSDPQDQAAVLTVTATPASGTGVTINDITVDGLGKVSASVAAGCAATNSTFTLRVTNSSNLFAEATLTVNVTANTAPVLSYNTQMVTTGTTPSFNPATGPSDNGTRDPIGLISVTPNTGLALSVHPTTGAVQVTSATKPGSYTVVISVRDTCLQTTNATFTVNVTCPTITATVTGGGAICSGGSAPVTVNVSGGTAPYTVTLTNGGGTQTGAGPFTFSVSPGSPSSYSVQSATDANGCPVTATGSATFTVKAPTEINMPPVNVTAFAGTPVTFSVGATGTELSYQWRKNGNDVPGATSSTYTIAAVTTAEDGDYDVVVTGACGSRTSSVATLRVCAMPLVSIIGPPSGAIYAVGTTVNFNGSFTDPTAATTHNATWTFDTLTQAGTVNETAGTVSGSHSFTEAGVYQVSLAVRNACGQQGSANTVGGLPALVVVYDPNAGFVTGGGWITSPVGAYVLNPDLTGKASFGFVSKYKNGNNVPTGDTEFQFALANLLFKSTAYEWLVISGARAQFKGAGTINGTGDYRFLLTAIDGQANGGGGRDKFRIRIWNNQSGGLVYDNQLNTPDNADPTTVLGGGQIVIHTGENGNSALAQTATNAAALAQSVDYDGDGKADAAVWRGQTSEWLIARSSDDQLQTVKWGASDEPYRDVAVCGDYDGDGKTDVAFFRRGNGHWYIRQSSDDAVLDVHWGLATDVPVPGDYDGDGKTDIAVWRGAESNWYILLSGRSSDGQTLTISWGTSRAPYRDVPVAADFDGDGKTDVAVFRQQNGHWYIKLSSDGSTLDKAWGVGTDVPVAADYDGDGKADIAVWRGAETSWYILRSSDNAVQNISWGASSLGDVPVPGDFDGDGKADVAVWRESEGRWYIKASRDDTVLSPSHGLLGAIPVIRKAKP